MAGNPTLPKENIDEVILGLLALEPNEVAELDYQTYSSYLRELLIEVTSAKRKIDPEEVDLVKNEFKRIRGKRGRFRIVAKKSKITSDKLGLGGIRKQVKGTQKRLLLKPAGGAGVAARESVEVISDKKPKANPLVNISNTLDSILNTLTSIYKDNLKKSERERKDAESKKRLGRESELESKTFEGIKKVASAILKPFESIWQKILKFITMILLGRALIKLLDWFADPKNQDKIRSIIRFFTDHWPTLLALYLRFGTGIGRFIGKLGGILAKGALKIGKIGASLLARLGLKGAGRFAKVLGGPKAKAVATGIGIAADVAVTAGTAMGISGLASGDLKVPGFSGGGWSSGLKNIFSGFGNIFGGVVKGPKGRDKVPAMLTDGEFVMSVGAVQKYGVDTLEAMNAAGGGTNVPQIANGITYAAGGGYVGDAIAAQEAWTRYMKANPEKFTKGAEYGSVESVNDASRDFMKTFIKTGKPPLWANIKQKTTKVAAPQSSRSSWWDDFSSKFSKQSPPNTTKPPTSSALTKSSGELSTQIQNVGPRKYRSGVGALQAAFAAMEFIDRKNQGQTNSQAGMGAAGSALGGSVGWMAGAKSGAVIGGGIGSFFGGVGAAPGAAIGAIIGGLAGGFGGASLGEKIADDLSGVNAAKERMSRGGIGGAVKGGYGLKQQSFKDAPKTMVMTDDKGRPFVGHKAMKNGKLTYVRPSKTGTGTTNPLEALGRMINPGAYKDSDSKVAMKNQRIAMANSLESFQKQGMTKDAQSRMMKQMGGNLTDVQNDLNHRRKMRVSGSQSRKTIPKPLPKPDVTYNPAGGGMGGRRGSGSNPSRQNSQKPRSQNPTHSSRSTRTARSTLGINK